MDESMRQHNWSPGREGRASSPTLDPDATIATIERILTHEWDPLGTAGGSSQGEYHGDALTLSRMMEEGVPEGDLEAYLALREAEMGVGGGTRRSRREVVTSIAGIGRE
jgi:hypothetical protein